MACKCTRCGTVFLDELAADIARRLSPQCPICLVSSYTDMPDFMGVSQVAKASQAARRVVQGHVYLIKGNKWYHLCSVWNPGAQCHAGDLVSISEQERRRSVSDPESLQLSVLDETQGADPNTTEILLYYNPAACNNAELKPDVAEIKEYLEAETDGLDLEVAITEFDVKERTVLVKVLWPSDEDESEEE